MSTNFPRYPEEFKQQVVEEVLGAGKPKTWVAREYGVSVGSGKNWVKQYGAPQKAQKSYHVDELKHSTSGTNRSRVDSRDKSVHELELEREEIGRAHV